MHIHQPCTKFINELPPLSFCLLNKEGYLTAAEPRGYRDNVNVTMLSFHCWRKPHHSIKTKNPKPLCVFCFFFLIFCVWVFCCLLFFFSSCQFVNSCKATQQCLGKLMTRWVLEEVFPAFQTGH